MAKVSGSYASVVRGVSEQVPQDRRPGQHFEQVNMISDPVRGLARRHGSILQDEKVVASYVEATHNKWLEDTARHKVFTFFVGGVEYDIVYRSKPDTGSSGQDAFAWAFNKDTRKIVPVVLGSDPLVASLVSGGVSAIVNVGKYLFLAGNTVVPSYAAVDKWAEVSNTRKMVVWFRGGAYSRNFTVTLTHTNGTKISKSYKTVSSSYQTLLSTSDILSTDPEYQKKVNDRVNAYNAEVNKWIGTAAADITPENIAEKLRALFAAEGVACSVVAGTLCFDDLNYKEVSVDDGGDGSLARAVGGQVANIDLVSGVHYPGKIVRVRPKKNNGKDALYLMAVAKDNSSNWTEVTWKEVAGYEMTPQAVFGIGTVKNETLYIGGTSASLTSLTGDPTPQFKVNEVGDDITSPLPYFMGKKIDYLGLFQDRLVVGSGAVLFFSRPGDYFNWFKSSVLSVADDDPVELYALGSEDDTIKTSTTYDRNLLLFGRRKQYTVNGRSPLSPKSASIVVISSHEDAVDADPINSGNFVFYSKTRSGVTSVHQIQMGSLADSPESFNISQQLDLYIQGEPVELVAVTAPNAILLRTTAARNNLYTYAYLDTATGAERLFDSWSKWEWDIRLGSIVGLSRHDGDVLVYLLRTGKDKDGNEKVWFACDRFVLDTTLSSYPYADSLRPTSTVLSPSPDSFMNPSSQLGDVMYFVHGKDQGNKAFLGTDLDHITEFIEQYPMSPVQTWTGVRYNAFVTPTNPYMRDNNGNAIVIGRLTLSRLSISIAESGGVKVEVHTPAGTNTAVDFSGRILGRASNKVGQAPIVTTVVPATIGKEVRECTYTVRARNFQPLTITAIEWTGQYFNNSRRV